MANPRGLFISFEGCDYAGKTTQINLLNKSLNQLNIPFKTIKFPNEDSPIGNLIRQYLNHEIHLSHEVSTLLFSANRWEYKKYIHEMLYNKQLLICDRYVDSGAVYTSVLLDKNLNDCYLYDQGLYKPDVIFLFKISLDTFIKRKQHNLVQIYETAEIQKKIIEKYSQLRHPKIIEINGELNKNIIQEQILHHILELQHDYKYLPLQKY